MRTLFALLPLVLFYVVESTWGLREAIVAAILTAAAEVAYTRLTEGRWSRLTLATAGLIVVLGGLSLLSDDERFVLFAPVVGDLVFAAVLAGAQLRGTNLVVWAIEEQDPEIDVHPFQRRWLDGLAWRFAANLVLHGILTGFAAGASREVWLLVSGPVQYGMMGLQVAIEAAYGRFVILPRVEEDESAGPPVP